MIVSFLYPSHNIVQGKALLAKWGGDALRALHLVNRG
jgi:hypothetical protein